MKYVFNLFYSFIYYFFVIIRTEHKAYIDTGLFLFHKNVAMGDAA